MSQSSPSQSLSAQSLSAKVLCVIPARYASQRFPGKPLVDIAGKPMIQRVWECASQVARLDSVVIATDDERIESVARDFGATVMMTDPAHATGTDRVWEVAQHYPQHELILNLQGDEPQMRSSHLESVIELSAEQPQGDIYTVVNQMTDPTDWHNPNVVKAVLTSTGKALYFSRAAFPYDRSQSGVQGEAQGFSAEHTYRHLGLYLYRRKALAAMTAAPACSLEKLESLEQLRAFEIGLSIYATCVVGESMGIDTPEDLQRLLPLLGA